MLIHLIAGSLFLYLLFRFIIPLPVSRKAKYAAGFLLLLASQQHLITRMIFGSLSSPELPPAAIAFQGWLFISLLLLFLLVLVRDMIMLAAWLVRRRPGKPEHGFSQGRRDALICGLAFIPSAYGVYKGVSLPEAHSLEARLPNLPRQLDGLSIVQLTDLHVSPLFRGEWVQAVVDRVNTLTPDLILFTGDMVDGLPARRATAVAPLKNLRARYGKYACVGNHEYYSDYSGWMKVFPQLGISMLRNSHSVLKIQDRDVVVAGLTDIVAERYGLPLPDCTAALSGAPEDAFRILLEHRPGAAAKNATAGIDLQLSGHTHGGQIIGLNPIVASFNNNYLYGWYKVEKMLLYVSSGAGLWNGFPVRLGVPSEIPRIVLRSAA